MKKYVLAIIIIFVQYSAAFAQITFETGVNQGYEWNIFKNPEILVEDSDTLRKNQLWQSSSYNELFLNTEYYRDWGDSRLRTTLDLNTNLYHQESQAHEFNYSLYSSFRSRYASSKYIMLNPRISRKNQDGVEREDPVFSSRLSYYQLRAPLHLDFYLGNLAWIQTEFRYRYRIYDKFDNQQTSYGAYYAEGHFKKSVDGVGRFDHEFESTNSIRYRDQVTSDFDNEGNEIEKSPRQFTKIEAEVLYRLQNRKGLFEVEFPVSGTMFYDHPSSNLDYREIEFGIAAELNLGKANIEAGVERTVRDFKNFDVGNNDETLFYNYWTTDIEVEYALTENINLMTKTRFITRTSTRERLTTAFYREYTNSYIQTGITVEL